MTTPPETSPPPIGKPSYQAALVDASGRISRTWLPWFNQLRTATESLATANTTLATVQAQVAAGSTSNTALTNGLAAANLAIAQAQAQIDDLNALTNALQSSVAALESDVAGISSGSASGALLSANNLSDLTSVDAARLHLGVSINESVQVNGAVISDDFEYFLNRAKQITVNGS